MDVIFVDFETYYDQDYSLSKMQTDAYVLDDRFETIMVSIRLNGKTVTLHGTEENIKYQLNGLLDWSKYAVVAHNTMFDGFIMAQRYGINPRMWLCTLALTRMVKPFLRSYSLSNISKFFGFQEKGQAVHNMKGVRRSDMDEKTFEAYKQYCVNDVDLCEKIYNEVIGFCPLLSQVLIDMTIRMFTEPLFVGNKPVMADLLEKEIARKEGLMTLALVSRDEIMSNAKFAERLRKLAVIPPTKVSPRTGKTTFAFAKTDKEFMELLEHPDSEVQALVAARVGAKTTIAQTRAERFIEMADRGPLPVYLQWWGAKTTGRYSGGNKVNWQNLPARGLSAGLRNALEAPPGYSVVVGDSSNIELRMVMALAGQEDALDKLRSGVDMYCNFASTLYGRDITKADKLERFLGKTAMLGLQYGAGAPRFAEMVRIQGRAMGAEPIELEKAYETVQLYRGIYNKVTELWRHCEHSVLPDIAARCDHLQVDVNGWYVTQYEGFGRPGEPGVVYNNLRYSDFGDTFLYDQGRSTGRKIYGPKVVENLCQHASMQVVMWQTARIHQKYPVKLSVHDEAVCIVPDSEVEGCVAWMEECLSTTPKWCQNKLPVVGEVEVGKSYGEAK